MKKKKPVFKIFGMSLFALLAALFAVGAFDTELKVVNYTLTDARIKTPVRLVLLTDLHSCNYGENQRELVSAIEAAAPDLILMSGDIADDEMDNAKTEELLAALQKRWPMYYVTGNHELDSDDPAALKELFTRYGADVLEGEAVTLTVGETELAILGVDDPLCGKTEFARQLQAAKAAAPDGVYRILLGHRPDRWEDYGKTEADLLLSGHAHGGQWRLPGLLNGLFAPNQGLFPKYAGGEYKFDTMTMIVSRGLARESTRLVPRIFNPPELVVIDLLSE